MPNVTLSGPEPGWKEATQAAAQATSNLNDIALLMNCLSGVSCFPGYATSYSTPDTPASSGGSGFTQLFDILPRQYVVLNAGTAQHVQPLVGQFQKAANKSKMRFRSALHRLAQAKGRLSDGDRALDLGIALEMLLLNAEHKGQELPGQLSLHFRLRGAWLLGSTADERATHYRDLRQIYSLRSQIAHNGFSEDLNEMDHASRQALLARHVSIAEKIVRELILRGGTVNWDQMILGG